MARRHRYGFAGPTAPAGAAPAAGAGRLLRLRAGAVEAARTASMRPFASFGVLLALNLAASLLFAAAGLAAGDPALFFRELMPGTWLSVAQLLFAAAAAWAIHERGGSRSVLGDLWGVAAVLFTIFAFDELTQTSQFAGILLSQGAGLVPAGGFYDMGAVVLTLLFGAAALAVLPRALVLLRHPAALPLFVAGVALGAASQGLDSFVAPSQGEFVAEETLKLCAEAALIGGLLVALRDVRRGRGVSRRPRPA